MSLDCSTVRERLADGEAAPELEAHLAGCAGCAAIARALVEVDAGIASLGTIEPPDALVAALLLRTEAAPVDARPTEIRETTPEPIGAPSLLVASLAVIASALGALIAAPFALARWLVTQRGGRWTFALGGGMAACAALLTVTFRASAPALDLALAERDEDVAREGAPAAEVATSVNEPADAQRVRALDLDGEELETGELDALLEDEEQSELSERESTGAPDEPITGLILEDALADGPGGERDRWQQAQRVSVDQTLLPGRTTPPPPPEMVDGRFGERFETELADRQASDREAEVRTSTIDRGEQTVASHLEGGETETTRVPPLDVQTQLEQLGSVPHDPAAVDHHGGSDDDGIEHGDLDGASTSRFWSEAERVDGLALRARDGWWSTTYVPGDPAIRALHARLASARDVRLGARDGLALAESAAPLASPIEAPTDRALALGAQADVAAVDGPTRVRLEVDLRAIRQSAGRRAPMRIAVVIDARSALAADEAARLRALLAALGRAAGARDRVTVIAAGAHGGTVVPLGALRHGEVEVALRRLLAGEGGALLSADAALAEAARAVASTDDVGLVLFATADATHDGAIDGALHRAAVAGVPTSVVALGDRARAADLDAIAIAGQGRRRIVRAPSDADAVARAEIEAASQLVARAMRIRVRLAPGVQLVDVLGSRPLDADESRRTREAERAIDVDLAQRLGISADREEDDDGVRIFVPAFYADDAHAIVLDLVVAGPGPVAEIDVRYKDLVRLENGQASSAVSLPRGAPSRGARELRVVTSMLAHDVARALATAGDRAQAGDRPGAADALREARATIDEAGRAMPRLARDRATTSLRRLLDGYLDALASPADPSLIAASARYASHRLIVRPRL